MSMICSPGYDPVQLRVSPLHTKHRDQHVSVHTRGTSGGLQLQRLDDFSLNVGNIYIQFALENRGEVYKCIMVTRPSLLQHQLRAKI